MWSTFVYEYSYGVEDGGPRGRGGCGEEERRLCAENENETAPRQRSAALASHARARRRDSVENRPRIDSRQVI